ncbi:uncharacterized protein LOC121305378 [Polyodon spathula]|uniref:uncharacterized protein LOC121305378 n=1 Tax=Polyodon spathula TaxID=7913 RepID=UPI001B7E3612|nr:uncharacterized protein LOC121305378 [Polyodon spathula]
MSSKRAWSALSSGCAAMPGESRFKVRRSSGSDAEEGGGAPGLAFLQTRADKKDLGPERADLKLFKEKFDSSAGASGASPGGSTTPSSLASAIDQAVETAVQIAFSKMTAFVERKCKCALLQSRMDDRERELESVRLRLEVAESELKTIRGYLSDVIADNIKNSATNSSPGGTYRKQATTTDDRARKCNVRNYQGRREKESEDNLKYFASESGVAQCVPTKKKAHCAISNAPAPSMRAAVAPATGLQGVTTQPSEPQTNHEVFSTDPTPHWDQRAETGQEGSTGTQRTDLASLHIIEVSGLDAVHIKEEEEGLGGYPECEAVCLGQESSRERESTRSTPAGITVFLDSLCGLELDAVEGFLKQSLQYVTQRQTPIRPAQSCQSSWTSRQQHPGFIEMKAPLMAGRSDLLGSVLVNPGQLREAVKKAVQFHSKEGQRYLLNKLLGMVFSKEELAQAEGVKDFSKALDPRKQEAIKEFLHATAVQYGMEELLQGEYRKVVQNKMGNSRRDLKKPYLSTAERSCTRDSVPGDSA